MELQIKFLQSCNAITIRLYFFVTIKKWRKVGKKFQEPSKTEPLRLTSEEHACSQLHALSIKNRNPST